MLLIKNGRVIDPAGKKERNADIVVKDGKIEKIYPEGTLPVEAEAAANHHCQGHYPYDPLPAADH